jgi:hypothetical protein
VSGLLVDLGPYIEDHVNAMLEATTASQRVAVLRSAITRHLRGQRLLCQRHELVLTIDELVNHVAAAEHEAGDIVPAPADPREAGRGGESGGPR